METNHHQLSWSRSQAINRAIGHVVLAAVGILFFLPFFWLVSTSLKEFGSDLHAAADMDS